MVENIKVSTFSFPKAFYSATKLNSEILYLLSKNPKQLQTFNFETQILSSPIEFPSNVTMVEIDSEKQNIYFIFTDEIKTFNMKDKTTNILCGSPVKGNEDGIATPYG